MIDWLTQLHHAISWPGRIALPLLVLASLGSSLMNGQLEELGVPGWLADMTATLAVIYLVVLEMPRMRREFMAHNAEQREQFLEHNREQLESFRKEARSIRADE